MIFKSIDNLHSKEDLSLFKELVTIYYKTVRELCLKNGISYDVTSLAISDNVVTELKSIGVIHDEAQIDLLRKTLDKDFPLFIYSVQKYIENQIAFSPSLYKLSNEKRLELQRTEELCNKPIVADFFAGAGGLSLGFIQAGFRIGFANDFEEVCVNTYRYNHPEIPSQSVVKADIREIVDDIDKYIKSDVDIVIGGPPCQGFSSANQQRIIDDPRNELYKFYLKAIERIVPKFVVMENVRGMLKVAEQVVEDYHNIRAVKDGVTYSYDVKYEILNAVDFSVAQSRERLIYIAIRNDVMQDKGISPSTVFEEIKASCIGKKRFNLSEALAYIKPLDAPRIKNTNDVDNELTGKLIDKNTFTGHDNEYLSLINNNRDIPLVYNHKARYLSDVNYDIYRLLAQGEDASNEKIADIMPYKHRLYCFKDKYYKLIANRPSRTITAHLRMDCHSHIHPTQIRAITPREAARCQSFPDDYLFLGAYLKTYMEIGNAVPCLMAKGIAETIKKHL